MLASLCIVLLLLLLAAASALLIDNKQKRLDRRVVTAAGMLDSHAASQASIRRQQVASRWKHLHRLVSYKPGMAYEFRAEYVVFAGIVLALAIMYVNIYLGLHFDYRFVFLVAIGVGTYVVRLLFKWQHRQLADKLFRQLPDTIQIVTSTVKAGSLVIDAFTNIAK
jgi:tight adherence protein B